MEQPVVFALTPRAGHWNQRYLVPEQSAWSEKQLGQWLSQAREESHHSEYLLVRRNTCQPTTGRIGEEQIILRDPRLTSIAPTQRRDIEERLEQCLSQLEELVTQQIDWRQNGRTLVVRRRELNAWQEDFAELLVRRITKESATMDPTPKEGLGMRVFTFFTVIVVLGFLGVGLFFWPWDGGTQSQPPRPPISSHLDAPIEELAQIVGVDTTSLPNEKIREQIADKLESDLFDWPEEQPTFSHPWHALTDEEQLPAISATHRLKRTLNHFLRIVFQPEARELELVELLELQGFTDKLQKLYPQPEPRFERTGLLTRSHKHVEHVGDLKRLDAIQFRRMISTLAELGAHLSSSEDDPILSSIQEIYKPLLSEIRTAAQSLKHSPVKLDRVVSGKRPHPKFYLEGELEHAQAIYKLLGGEAMQDLSGKRTPPRTLRERLELLNKPDTKKDLSSEPLSTLSHADRKTPARSKVFQLLDEFLNACREAVKDP